MAVIVPADRSVEALEGIHLYHGDISNCSMRVRMTLIEKGLPWTSHHLDLKLKENISDGYFAINPNGLVPTLIDNGVVHIESNDIIDHLDRTYPEPSLRAAGDEDEMLEWLRLAASIHVPAVKPYVYATKMQKKLKKTVEEQEKYDELQKNEELKRFHARHAGGSAFGERDVARARETLEACFARLEGALRDREWMMGDRFTLADISWIPLHFVLAGCGYPFEHYPNVSRWAAAHRDKESYRDGILKWCPDFAEV